MAQSDREFELDVIKFRLECSKSSFKLDELKAMLKKYSKDSKKWDDLINSKALADGSSPIINAAAVGSLPLVKFLIEMGAEICDRKWDGNTPLHVAIRNDNISVAYYLVRVCNVPVDSTSWDGHAPLHDAAKLGSMEAVKLLMEHGANLRATNKSKYYSFQEAKVKGNHKVANLIINAM